MKAEQRAPRMWSTRLTGVARHGLPFVVTVVIVVFGLLWTGPRYTEGPEVELMRVQLSRLRNAVENYQARNHAPPTTRQGLEIMLSPPGGVPPGSAVVWASDLKDPWGEPYRYQSLGLQSGRAFDVWSVGPDKTDRTEDDVRLDELAAK